MLTEIRKAISGWMRVSPDFTFLFSKLNAAAVYRVVWLRAHSRKLRWEEELAVLPLEMDQSLRSLQREHANWKSRSESATKRGDKAWAARQSALWSALESHARGVYETARSRYKPG